MDKKYQVFISSTFDDLRNERQSVLKAILGVGHLPSGMELFPASDETAWQLICDVIDVSDYYCLIIGGRYGSLDKEGLSYTEKEYKYATKNNIPVIPLLHKSPDNLPRGKTDTDPKAWKKLQDFRVKVEEKHTCSYWETPNELETQVILSLISAIKRLPRQGWVQFGSLASDEASRQIIELRNLVDKQKKELDHLSNSPPIGAEEFAQGDDVFELNVRVTLNRPGYDYSDSERTVKITFKTKATWDELFKSFAPNLMEPNRDTRIKSDVARYLRDKHEPELSEQHPEHSVASSTITETAFQQIRLQFTVLGLIECYMEKRMYKDTEKEFRFCKLTEYGLNHLFKTNAILKQKT